MKIKFEKINENYMVYVDSQIDDCTLEDLENLKTHLEYFINNESVKEINIKIGE